VSSRAKGNQAPAWLADYLQPWWPGCEKTPNSRPGRDVLGTPGVAFEVKTAREWRPTAWQRQAGSYAQPGEVGVLVYYPDGYGRAATGDTLAIVRTRLLLPVLVEAGYAPEPKEA
jgi:hypothetical protein